MCAPRELRTTAIAGSRRRELVHKLRTGAKARARRQGIPYAGTPSTNPGYPTGRGHNVGPGTGDSYGPAPEGVRFIPMAGKKHDSHQLAGDYECLIVAKDHVRCDFREKKG